MDLPSGLLIAAAIPPGPYVNVVKIAVVVVLLLGWAAVAQWVDRDTDVVKTKREQWNIIVLSGGVVASLVLLIPPLWHGSMFAVGLAFWALLAGAPVTAYLIHRNARVVPSARLFTRDHFKRVAGRTAARKPKSKGLRVQVTDHAGNFVEMPDDPEEGLAFEAVQDFLYDVIWRRSADTELQAEKDRYRLIYRIDGVPIEQPDGVSAERGERLVRYLKKLAGLNVEEIRRPQAGRIQAALLSHDGDPGYADVRTSGTTAGERLRLCMHAGPTLLRLHELGVNPQRLEALKQCLAKKKGFLLLSAPPQHGLTTTQYAVLRGHDAYMNNIHALERRPLTELDNITQRRFDGANTDLNYARMLQTVLRREPDIVMVGECEDRESALLAARAAETRKVYMGLQATDTFDALSTYLRFLNDNALAAKALVGVVNQRLIRILCQECKEAFKPDPAMLKKLNLPADRIEHFYRPPTEQKVTRRGKPVVCQTCQGTGYVGRTGIFELLAIDESISRLIAEGAPINRIKAQARKNKMYYLQEEGLLKVIDGTTSMNEILRCLRTSEK